MLVSDTIGGETISATAEVRDRHLIIHRHKSCLNKVQDIFLRELSITPVVGIHDIHALTVKRQGNVIIMIQVNNNFLIFK